MIEIRTAETDDVDFLWEMVFYASHSDHETAVTLADAQKNPDLIRHIGDWGRPGDMGIVAWSVNEKGQAAPVKKPTKSASTSVETSGFGATRAGSWSEDRRVGACWLRLILEHERGDGSYFDDVTPELVIAVDPTMTGSGIGSLMIKEMLTRADTSGVPSIVLTARAENRAIALYERSGFELLERLTNRVGSESVKMLRRRAA